MSESQAAFLIWLPLGTLVPFVVSRLTGADWRGAFIEASIFAALGMLIYPTMIALIVARFVGVPPATLLFIGGYLLAALSVLLIRRRANRRRQPRYRRRL